MRTIKNAKILKLITGIISFLLNTTPIIVAVIYVMFKESGEALSRVMITGIACGILIALNYVFKTSFRSVQWLMFLGFYGAISNVPNFIIAILVSIAICTVIDDLFIAPLHAYYKDKYRAAKTAYEVVNE